MKIKKTSKDLNCSDSTLHHCISSNLWRKTRKWLQNDLFYLAHLLISQSPFQQGQAFPVICSQEHRLQIFCAPFTLQHWHVKMQTFVKPEVFLKGFTVSACFMRKRKSGANIFLLLHQCEPRECLWSKVTELTPAEWEPSLTLCCSHSQNTFLFNIKDTVLTW